MPDIDYFYSTRSIYAYFGAKRIAEIARRAGRRLVHKPVDLSKVVPAFAGAGFEARTPKQRAYYFGREIERWSQFLGVPALVDPSHHYGDRTLPSGFVIAAQRLTPAQVDALHLAVLEALWRFDRDIADRAVLADLARGVGADPAPLLDVALSDDVQAEFARNSAEAIERGVPGSPTYVADGEVFYGQDHLAMLERHLATPFKPGV
ncbi:MAG: 2-hydroxychromene-2-carboxylate isomerase [Alphaproteobacteria bacterium]|nr:2-hydroxychromene-2-carboxylate isomerase [Alphaproteobacteria bacterium]